MSHKINLLARFLALLEMTYFPILQNSIIDHVDKETIPSRVQSRLKLLQSSTGIK